jgi:O-antigen/teichoic acid export membrane protein
MAAPLSYSIVRAALTAGTAHTITRVLTVMLSIASARALEPREVGVLGLAVIVVGIISMIGYYPEMAAVTARGEDDDQKYALAALATRAAIITLLLVSVLISLPALAGYLTEKEVGSNEIRALLGVLLFVPLLELISGYPRVILQRRLDLNYVSGANLLQPLLFVGLAVYLLWRGHGYIAVAWANLAGTAAATLFLWLRLWFKGWLKWQTWPTPSIWRETARGAARIFVGGFGGFLGERVDNLLVAGLVGATGMSFYSMAWNGARTPANVFGGTIGFVLVPALARIQDEPLRVERAIRESIRYSYLLLAPVCAVLFVSAPLLVTYILGERWLPLVPCLRIMCFTVLTIPVLFASGALLTGTGRAHLTGIAMLIHLIVLVAAVVPLAAHWGIIGAAAGDLLAMVVSTTVLCITARKATGQRRWDIASNLFVPIAAAVPAAVMALSVGAGLTQSIFRLIAEVAIVTGGYLLFVILLGGRARLFDLVSLLQSVTRRRAFPVESRT